MITAQAVAQTGTLPAGAVRQALEAGLGKQFTRQKVLVLISDHTRSLPMANLFRLLVEVLADARQLDFMVALGTHPALSEENLNRLVGITTEERAGRYRGVGLYNHTWDNPAALARLGQITEDEVRALAGELWHASLAGDVDVRINRAALEYDQVIILAPTFPHEVAGFSGGAKYLFPGISGPEMIHRTHWLGAMAGVVQTIGIQNTPARGMIHLVADKLPTPVLLVALVVEGHDLAGILIGDYRSAWEAAAGLSAQRHIRWCDRPFQRVLSVAPPMYDELWTAAKAMYKLEPAVALGGEVVIFAPHLDTVSRVHGNYIAEVGYHILPYFLADWERFRHVPLGVLAHSTHLRGSGHMEGGVERSNVRVTLASQISAEECARLNLGYLDPTRVNLADWQNREDEAILYVPKAGEILYRLRD